MPQQNTVEAYKGMQVMNNALTNSGTRLGHLFTPYGKQLPFTHLHRFVRNLAWTSCFWRLPYFHTSQFPIPRTTWQPC